MPNRSANHRTPPAAPDTAGIRPRSEPAGNLLRDRLLVTAAAVLCAVGTLLGTGLVGGSEGVQQQGDGLFSDRATLIAPQGPAFSIWSAIYLGLAGYVIWQWLPATRTSRWAGTTRLLAAAAIALNGIWLLVVYANLVWLSVAVIAALVASLGLFLPRISPLPREGWAADILVGLTFGVYLGWSCVATCANIALALVGSGVPPVSPVSTWITVAVLAAVLAIAGLLLWRGRQPWFRAGLAGAMVWGTAWVAAGRLTGEPRSTLVGYAAAISALAVAALGVWAVATARRARIAV